MFWGHPRRKKAGDGYFDDIYTDPLISLFGERESFSIEAPYLWRHLRPRRHRRTYHADSVLVLAHLLTFFRIVRVNGPTRALARSVSQEVASVFGNDYGTEESVLKAGVDLKAKRFAFRLLLSWLRPHKVVAVNAYGCPGLILAARDLRIPTAELQHGVITAYHLGYAVARGERLQTAADSLLLFGEYWQRVATFGVADEKLIILGFPYFELEQKAFTDIQKTRKVVFVSQGTVGAELSMFAVRVARDLAPNLRVVYKLHPGEKDRWRHEYPWLVAARGSEQIEVIEGDQPSLYSLFAQSSWVCGVNSTAIFEAIGFGCAPVIVKLPGHEQMQPLIKDRIAKLVSVDDPFPVETGVAKNLVDDLFRPGSQDRFLSFIHS